MSRYLVTLECSEGPSVVTVEARDEREAKEIATEPVDGILLRVVSCELIETKPHGEDKKLRKMGAPALPGLEGLIYEGKK